jgi:molybdate transport system substrate-binding protein
MNTSFEAPGFRGALVVALAWLLGACSPQEAGVLRIAAAVSLREPLDKIAARFDEADPVRVQLSYGATSDLAAQLRAGAPLDVLLSADEEIPRALQAEDVATDLRPFATNRLLVIASEAAAPLVRKPSDLTGDAVRRIALPGPSVPLGHYAREWLARVDLLSAVLPRIVQTEHARATLAAVESGSADAAILYVTDARVATSARVAFQIPDAEQPKIVYMALRAKASKQAEAAERFLASLADAESTQVLLDTGFGVPGATAAR